MSKYVSTVCRESPSFYYNGDYNNSPISDLNAFDCMYLRTNRSKEQIFTLKYLHKILFLKLEKLLKI